MTSPSSYSHQMGHYRGLNPSTLTRVELNGNITQMYKNIPNDSSIIDTLVSTSTDPNLEPDPFLELRFTVTLPCLLSRIRILNLEVHSKAWHILNTTFRTDRGGDYTPSNLEELAITRIHYGPEVDSQEAVEYTVAVLNDRLNRSTSAWRLRTLLLTRCILDLTAPYIALSNLEELWVDDLPRAASVTQHDVLAIIQSLPRLKRLSVGWEEPLPYIRHVAPNSRVYHHQYLEWIYLRATLEEIHWIFTSLKLRPTCNVTLIANNVPELAAAWGFTHVSKLLIGIGMQHRMNGGSAFEARVVADSNLCVVQSSQSDLSLNSDVSATNFSLVLDPFPEDILDYAESIPDSIPDTLDTIPPCLLRAAPEFIGPMPTGSNPPQFTHLTLFHCLLSIARTAFSPTSLSDLKLEVGWTPAILLHNFYLSYFTMARATFKETHRLQSVQMECPHPWGPFSWKEGASGGSTPASESDQSSSLTPLAL